MTDSMDPYDADISGTDKSDRPEPFSDASPKAGGRTGDPRSSSGDDGGDREFSAPAPDSGSSATSPADAEPEEDPDFEEGKQFIESARIHLEAGGSVVGGAKMAGTIYENCHVSYASQETQALLPEHFDLLSPRKLEERAAAFFVEENDVDRLRQVLLTRRLLILHGPADLGKGALALSLAVRLQADGGRVLPDGRRAEMQGALSFDSTSRKLKFPPDWLSGTGQKRYGSRVLVIQDAFQAGAATLQPWMSATGMDSLGERLEARGSYLVATSDSECLPHSLRTGSFEDRVHRLSPPGPEVLLQALHALTDRVNVNHFRRDPELCDAITALVDEKGEDLARRLGNIPRIARFLDRYLVRVALGELTLDDACRRLDDLGIWLFQELPEDLDAWAFALALLLNLSLPGQKSAPYLTVDRIWRALSELLRRELRVSREARTPQGLVADRRVLAAAHVEILPAVFPGSEQAAFEARIDPSHLWDVLLSEGRGLAALLVPWLEGLLSSRNSPFDVRICAARALGRLGQSHPSQLTLRYLRTWPRAEHLQSFLDLGQLLQGVEGSREEAYRRGVREQLRRVLKGARKPKEIVPWTVALAVFGAVDMPRAAESLRKLTDRAVGLSARQSEEIGDVLRKVQLVWNALRSSKADSHPRWGERILEAGLFYLTSQEEFQVLWDVKHSLVGLALANEPVDVLGEIAGWLQGEEELVPFIVQLLLEKNGILETLGSVAVHGEIDGTIRLLRGCFGDPGRLHQLRWFAHRLYEAVDRMPGPYRVPLRDRVVDLLMEWLSSSRRHPEARSAAIELLRLLVADEGRPLASALFQKLRRKLKRRKKDSDLRDLILEVLSGGGAPKKNKKEGVLPPPIEETLDDTLEAEPP